MQHIYTEQFVLKENLLLNDTKRNRMVILSVQCNVRRKYQLNVMTQNANSS